MTFDLQKSWYRSSWHAITWLLLPVSWLFALACSLRRFFYRVGIFKTIQFNVPVIVVGNITVGGTGKTPFVIWLARFLKSQGYRPGIVSRGYGGQYQSATLCVDAHSLVSEVGDEAILIARQAACPVVIGKNRVLAVQELLDKKNCTIVISDDGLQHYHLGRAIEIAMVDGVRRFGNSQLLPAGPLREPVSRLSRVDFVVVNQGNSAAEFTMTLAPTQLISLHDHRRRYEFHQFPHHKVHAVAAIGHPDQFFDTLKQAGFDVMSHAFPDHYAYRMSDFSFTDAYPIIMTEKDAVKCEAFADERYWYLDVTMNVSESLQQQLLAKLKQLESSHEVEADFAKRSCASVRPVERN